MNSNHKILKISEITKLPQNGNNLENLTFTWLTIEKDHHFSTLPSWFIFNHLTQYYIHLNITKYINRNSYKL